jgi:hypothetical protein
MLGFESQALDRLEKVQFELDAAKSQEFRSNPSHPEEFR